MSWSPEHCRRVQSKSQDWICTANLKLCTKKSKGGRNVIETNASGIFCFLLKLILNVNQMLI